MSLTYVAPLLKQGMPIAQLQLKDMEIKAAKWKYDVIMYVIGDSPTIAFLRNYLKT